MFEHFGGKTRRFAARCGEIQDECKINLLFYRTLCVKMKKI